MEGKHEPVHGKSPQPNKLWAQGQPDPNPDFDSFSVSWGSFLLLERKRRRRDSFHDEQFCKNVKEKALD